ncbi:multidrug ABC transporter permease [Lapidilactobacillus concavus]|nr:DUF2975 domain-containing protein [Lapidilactobacillus concavus]GEL12494.1 multidrug ABC transporter permease [Lapidilactobacillus concavus]
MKKRLYFLKIVLALAVLVVLMIEGLITTQFVTSPQQTMHWADWLFLLVVWIAIALLITVAFFLNRLLNLIQGDDVFSPQSLPIVRAIRRLIYIIGIDAIGILPFFYEGAQLDDAPGLMLFGLGVVFIPFAVGVFASVFEQLLTTAIQLKTENSLTI